jgi:hypothetical protein
MMTIWGRHDESDSRTQFCWMMPTPMKLFF